MIKFKEKKKNLRWRTTMKIHLPTPLYQAFPFICVIVGFLSIALVQNPLGIITSSGLYIYAYRVMWLRKVVENDRECR